MRKREFFLVFFFVFFPLSMVAGQENPHKKSPFPCEVCHSPTTWKNIQFNHTNTNFYLEGEHVCLKCTDCHNIADFSLTQPLCSSCHVDVHQEKLNPQCNICHTSRNWIPRDVYRVHSNTTFPIIGAHGKLDCDACHISETEGRFSGIRSDCYSCHRMEFTQTANPIHSEIGFGIHCEDCHSMFGWRPATFADHDTRFPISSGKHAGEWSRCQDCHGTPGNYTEFSCLNCHAHRQDKMNEKHREEGGYVYDSRACYRCHPRGRAEDE